MKKNKVYTKFLNNILKPQIEINENIEIENLDPTLHEQINNTNIESKDYSQTYDKYKN